MSQKTELPEDDSELFRRELGAVKPLRHDKVAPVPKPISPLPKQTLLEEKQIMRDLLSDEFDPAEIETGEELLFSRAGLQQALLRKLRRGHYSISAQLDLHGLTVPEAHLALGEFLAASQASYTRCVKIIHGKGLGSRGNQPVLKTKVNVWLRRREDILAFCSARPMDGGTGAIYVLLRKL